MTTSIGANSPIKSWLGLGFGAFCVVIALLAWFESRNPAHLVSAVGFLCWSLAWSQLPFSLTGSLREQIVDAKPLGRVPSALTVVGLVLVCASVAMRWLV